MPYSFRGPRTALNRSGDQRIGLLVYGLLLLNTNAVVSAANPHSESARIENELRDKGHETTIESLLVIASNHKDLSNRYLAVNLLGLKKAITSRETLAQIVSSEEDRYLRILAALALARIDDPRGIPAMVDFLETSEKESRKIFLAARLAELHIADGYTYVIDGLKSTDHRVRSSSLIALGLFIKFRDILGLGEDPVDRLIMLSEDPSVKVRSEAVLQMSIAIRDAVPAESLLPRLKVIAETDSDPEIRKFAAGTIRGLEFWNH